MHFFVQISKIYIRSFADLKWKPVVCTFVKKMKEKNCQFLSIVLFLEGFDTGFQCVMWYYATPHNIECGGDAFIFCCTTENGWTLSAHLEQ